MPLSDGLRLLQTLEKMRCGWQQGKLRMAPGDIPPQLACEAAGVEPELIAEDPFGWTVHLTAALNSPGEALRFDRGWSYPWRLMTHADVVFLYDMHDAAEELGLDPDGFTE